MRRLHRALAVLLLIGYGYVLLNRARLLPGLVLAWRGNPGSGSAGTGVLLVYALPLAGIACLLGARGLMRRFSPRVRPSYDYLLDEAFWYVAGYGLLAVGACVALLFR